MIKLPFERSRSDFHADDDNLSLAGSMAIGLALLIFASYLQLRIFGLL